MKIILIEDVQGLGKAGEMVNCKPGYFHNFLERSYKAIEATPANKKKWEAEQKKKRETEAENRKQAEDLKEKLEAVDLKIDAKGGSEGRLFGSITAADIAKALKKQSGIDVDKKKIELKENIKTTGTQEVTVRVYPEMTATLKVTIQGA